MRRLLAITLVWLGLSQAALAFGSCEQVNYLDHFAVGLAPEACTEIAHHTIRTARGVTELRLIRLTADGHGADAAFIPHTAALAERLGPAIDDIGAELPPEITLLLTATTREIGGRQAHAVTQSLIDYGGGATECAVPVYKLDRAVSTDEFVMAAAHEVFHCAQRVTWPSAFVTEGSWWMEGSAEYFSHLVMPESRLRDGWFAEFDRRSANEPLTATTYENVVFFMFLATEGGPAGVGDFLSAMRSGNQLAVLQEFVSPGEWERFLVALIDGTIERPGGGQLAPIDHFTAERSFHRSDRMDLETQPFVATRYRLTFEAEKTYELAYAAGAGDPQMAMRLDTETGAWGEPPTTVRACAEDQIYVQYFAATDAAADAGLDVTTDEDDTGAKCCLVGEWLPTQEALDGLAREGMEVGGPAIGAQGGSMSCSYEGGDWLLSFRDDGTGSLEFRNNTSQCTVSMPQGRMVGINTRNGTTDFTYQLLEDGGGAKTNYTGIDVIWTIVMKIGPISQTMSKPDDGPYGGPSGMAFICDGDALTIKGIYGLSHEETPHVRAVPAAP